MQPSARVGAIRPAPHMLGVCAFLAAGLIHAAAPAAVHASNPMGVYTLVEDVRIESGKPGEPDRVRIDGVSALAVRIKSPSGHGAGVYTDPERGYLYFECPDGRADVCRMEWSDLEAAIGSDRCAAYGDRYLTDPEPNGRLRPPVEAPPTDPDVYPIGMGVTLAEPMDSLCEAIHAVAAGGAAKTDGRFLPSVAGDGAAITGAAEDSPEDIQARLAARRPSAGDVVAEDAVAAQGPAGGTGDVDLAPRVGLVLTLAFGLLALATGLVWSRRRVV